MSIYFSWCFFSFDTLEVINLVEIIQYTTGKQNRGTAMVIFYVCLDFVGLKAFRSRIGFGTICQAMSMNYIVIT